MQRNYVDRQQLVSQYNEQRSTQVTSNKHTSTVVLVEVIAIIVLLLARTIRVVTDETSNGNRSCHLQQVFSYLQLRANACSYACVVYG